MADMCDANGDEDWVIWNGGLGVVTTAALGEVECGPNGRVAWLDEPFDMVGPFDLDLLETEGRISFAACMVMSRERWRLDQATLKRESATLRRAAQQRMDDTFERYVGRQRERHHRPAMADDRPHREALALPASGRLERKQINVAFRRQAQKAHPDAGGSHEQFVRISTARDALLAAL